MPAARDRDQRNQAHESGDEDQRAPARHAEKLDDCLRC
jgi:hypothetical protein